MAEQMLDHGEDISFEGLDDLIDQHLDGPAPGDPPKPAAEDAPEPEDEPEDIPDRGPDDEDLEEEVDEVGEEELEADDSEEEDDDEDEPDEPDEDSADKEEDEEEEVEDVLESVTADGLQRIKADPDLNRLHKLMQRDYTRKTTGVATRERGVELRGREIDQFESELGTAQGMADYLADTFTRRPDVVGAAFEAVATGQNGLEFLVEIGLHKADVFEQAYERVQELLSDEDERKRHVRERDTKIREADLDRKEQKLRRAKFDTDYTNLTTIAEKEARRLGIEKDDDSEVMALLKEKVRGRVREDGSIDLGRREVRAAVKTVKETLDRHLERARQRLERRQSKESLERTKSKARKAKERNRVPPNSPSRKAPRQQTPFKAPEGVDGLDAFIDARLAEQ